MAKIELLEFESRDKTINRMISRAGAAQLPGVLEGQVVRNLAAIISDELQSQHNRNSFAMAQSFPSTANGPYLDFWGESWFNMPRQSAVAAYALASDRNVEFSAPGSDLYSLLPRGSDSRAIIPEGTLIHDGNGNDYRTDADTTVLPGDERVYVGVEATVPGIGRNVPANTLTKHTLDQRIAVRNLYDISTGSDVESDRNYRFRVMRGHLGSQGDNRAALELSVAGVDGISQFLITEGINGPGTVEVLIVPTGNRVPQSVRQLVEQAARDTRASGASVIVREPNYVHYEITIRVLRRTKQETTAAAQAARQVVAQVLGGVAVGGSFSYADLQGELIASLRQYGATAVDILCFLLNDQPVNPGLVRLARRDLLVPSPKVAEPVRVLTA